ncbi:hypothetical protein [Vibrio quintilis]|uniref:Uncharacterized protein n=1 Tax=Vibrio quintilis TaxID=1117707 RepID=A0A1M7YTY5_9VIBR|nr:hypothetical protein [Vibrio quintilis]SHO56079.1 hypothetical protein VQ7734_01842 [Vibrio quintilis]
MDLIFLPLIIPFFYRSRFCLKDILFNLLYLSYCVTTTWVLDIPPGHRIGALIGIPVFSYLIYYFPELVDQRGQYPIENSAVAGLIFIFVLAVILF